jgi:hypothetical protein
MWRGMIFGCAGSGEGGQGPRTKDQGPRRIFLTLSQRKVGRYLRDQHRILPQIQDPTEVNLRESSTWNLRTKDHGERGGGRIVQAASRPQLVWSLRMRRIISLRKPMR